MTRTEFIATYILQNTHRIGIDLAVKEAVLAANEIYGAA